MTPDTNPSNTIVSDITFSKLGLHPNLLATLKRIGYTEPTPIQKEAIPHVLQRKDIVGLAQTGTGKTAAYMLPILNRLFGLDSGILRTLIIVPTRELAEQVNNTVRQLAEGTAIKTTTLYGGVRIENQKQRLKKPLDVVVGCPGRILDLINQRSLKLSHIETLVLDEADHMFDMGFIEPIRKILKVLPQARQNLLFSATMPDPIRKLINETLVNPVQIQVAPISSPDTLTHMAYPVPQHLKQNLLKTMLTDFKTDSVLVFTKTKHKARKLARFLDRNGLAVTSLQGNLSQGQRLEAMKGFRSGRYTIMVATDIAARGLDVSTISHVINYDLPDTTENYLHRVGRTGRARREGDAISFVSPQDEGQFRRLERVLGLSISKMKLEGFDYKAQPVAIPEYDQDQKSSFEGRRREGNRSSRGRFSRNKDFSRKDDRKRPFSPSRRRHSSSASAARAS